MRQLVLPNGKEIYYIDELTALDVYREIFKENIYFKHDIEIKNGDIVFDVGANIGLFSLYIADLVSDLNIYAFEPVEPIFKILKANVADLSCNITTYNIGLSKKDETIEFFYYPKVSADSAAVQFDWDYKVEKYVENYKEAVCKNIPIARIVPKFLRKRVVRAGLKRMYQSEKIQCRLRSLSDIIREEKIEQIDFLKIDAENFEKQVIAGIEDDHWNLINQIAMEVHEHIKSGKNLLNKFIKLLENKSFNVKVGEEDIFAKLGVYMLYATKN
ncbi:MAG: FkbM family methyltransferase [Candidatus Lokiarchaeota archaeon]|nr:FkbM family methyltransferase [Candidatus Lokiarchaeota archaeon]